MKLGSFIGGATAQQDRENLVPAAARCHDYGIVPLWR